MNDSNQSKEEKKPTPYYWWNGEDLVAFLANLNNRDLSTTRVEFHPDTLMLHVVDTGAQTKNHDPFNFAHVCPPDCG